MMISSFSPPREESFEGYAFVGADFISGSDGFSRFRECGGTLGPGSDGCYAVLRRTASGWEAGTDARGLRKLFLYRKGGSWALGSSLHDLVSHLRVHHAALTPNLAVLRALGVRQALTAQLNSTHTIFHEIELVPSFCAVHIDETGPQVIPFSPRYASSGYEEALAQHLFMWRSRFATLTSDPRTTFVTDLSGGLDSRVVFAFALASGVLDDGSARVQVASQERMPEDFAAATRIASEHGVNLNGAAKPMRTPTSPERAVENWKHHSLGVYMPVYLSPHVFDPLSVRCHGAGGGTFRNIFTGTSLKHRLTSTKKNFEDATFEEYSSIVLGDLEALSALRPDVDPQKLHYREFRNRFHFGHAPQTRTTFSPLNSILVDAIADRPDADDRRTYFDLMDSLVPGLKSLPYDDPSKAPKRHTPSDTARRMAQIHGAPGRMFADLREGQADKRDQRRAFSLFYSMAARAVSSSTVQEIIGDPRVLTRTRQFLREVQEQSGRPRANATGHQDASYVITAAFAADEDLQA
ncbi:hypothetical protein [Brachybacterium sp. P6-10-X1]|uniref:hypothetical protein n=1 Tax=Brachybacterium sp. P6-10-X1 TaxID=1903186 RepID=UPI0012F76C82|nr:hypothetical protein [Brachybacterium sp. P6-10-X1]